MKKRDICVKRKELAQVWKNTFYVKNRSNSLGYPIDLFRIIFSNHKINMHLIE